MNGAAAPPGGEEHRPTRMAVGCNRQVARRLRKIDVGQNGDRSKINGGPVRSDGTFASAGGPSGVGKKRQLIGRPEAPLRERMRNVLFDSIDRIT